MSTSSVSRSRALARRNEALKARHDRTRVHLLRWMEHNHMTREGVAAILRARRSELEGADHTYISKFLCGEPMFVPTASRPKKIALLEELEALCGDDGPLVSAYAGPCSPEHGLLGQWIDEILARTRMYSSKLDPAEAVNRFQALYAQVLHLPENVRTALCANILGHLGGVTCRPEAALCSQPLWVKTDESARQLLEAACAAAPEAATEVVRERGADNARGYAGVVLSYSGWHRKDRAGLDDGIALLQQAVASQQQFAQLHCANYCHLLEQLLRRNHRAACTLAEQGGAFLLGHWSELVHATLAVERHYPILVEHWEDSVPELAERLVEPAAQLEKGGLS